MRTRFLPLVILVACGGPAGDPPNSGDLQSGAFLYHARSSTGQTLLEGQIEFRVGDDSNILGSWNIRWAPGADTTLAVGPQVGSGQLSGYLAGTDLILQLNPEMADNNVSLRATRGPRGFAGRWEWSTIAGPTAGGAFEATRSDSLPTAR
jgi:hypothetical protein